MGPYSALAMILSCQSVTQSVGCLSDGHPEFGPATYTTPRRYPSVQSQSHAPFCVNCCPLCSMVQFSSMNVVIGIISRHHLDTDHTPQTIGRVPLVRRRVPSRRPKIPHHDG